MIGDWVALSNLTGEPDVQEKLLWTEFVICQFPLQLDTAAA